MSSLLFYWNLFLYVNIRNGANLDVAQHLGPMKTYVGPLLWTYSEHIKADSGANPQALEGIIPNQPGNPLGSHREQWRMWLG